MGSTVLGLLVVCGLLGIGLSTPANATALGSEGKIAFVRSNQIYTMTKTGGSVKQLTTTGKNYRPKWSPDGKHIAYIQEDVSGNKNVYEMTATGTAKTKVTTSGTVTATAVWSPSGQTLAFGQTDATGGSNVYLVRATAPFGVPSALAAYRSYSTPATAGPISVLPGSSLAWSPNGADLAVFNGDSEDSPDYGIHLVRNMTNAVAGEAAAHPEDVIAATGSDGSTYQDWSDLNFIPNGVFGYATVDHGDEWSYDPNPHILLVYPGFVSQQGGPPRV